MIADVRVATELGARPVGVITTLTIQNTTGVAGDHPVDAEVLEHQLAHLLGDIEIRSVKIGMLGSLSIARAIASALQLTNAPVVLDPILAPTRGELSEFPIAEAILALRPHLTLITPNAHELAALTGMAVTNLHEAEVAGRALATRLDAAVLVKGGHLEGDAIDLLIRSDVIALPGPRIRDGEHVHGTGCALSTAIATHLALGRELLDACKRAKQYVAEHIAGPARPGRGAAAIV